MRRVEFRRPIIGRLLWGWIGFAGFLLCGAGWLIVDQANKPKIGTIALNIDENATRLALPENANVKPELRLSPPEGAVFASTTSPTLASSKHNEASNSGSALRRGPSTVLVSDHNSEISGPKTYIINDENSDTETNSDEDDFIDRSSPYISTFDGTNLDTEELTGEGPAFEDNSAEDNPEEDNPGELVITIDGVSIDEKKPGKSRAVRKEVIKPLKQPLSSLTQTTQYGDIPKIDNQGRRASNYYAKPHTLNTEKKQVAFVVSGLGLNAELTEFAIEALPGKITLAFAPYAEDLDIWTKKARANGHEVIIEIPMEGYGPNAAQRIGPAGLLTTHSEPENNQRLDWILSRTKGYFAVTNYQGGRFSADEKVMAPVIKRLMSLGLAYIDDTGAATKPTRSALLAKSRIISPAQGSANSTKMKTDLANLRQFALAEGQAIGKIIASRASITILDLYLDELEDEEIELAPASALLYANSQ